MELSESDRALAEDLIASRGILSRLLNELSLLTACSSPDGSAEIGVLQMMADDMRTTRIVRDAAQAEATRQTLAKRALALSMRAAVEKLTDIADVQAGYSLRIVIDALRAAVDGADDPPTADATALFLRTELLLRAPSAIDVETDRPIGELLVAAATAIDAFAESRSVR